MEQLSCVKEEILSRLGFVHRDHRLIFLKNTNLIPIPSKPVEISKAAPYPYIAHDCLGLVGL